MTRRWAPWIAVGLASLALLAAVAWRGTAPAGAGPGAAAIGGPFHLVDQTGKPVDQGLLKGKWSAVFFGYTYCPNVCPTTLQALGQVVREMGDRARDFQVVFVTVDPARDTPEQLKAYLSGEDFPPGTIGLTGADQQVADAAKAYKVFYQKAGEGTNYTVDHSSAIYLMNPKGQFDSVLAYGMTPDQMRDSIVKAMSAKPA